MGILESFVASGGTGGRYTVYERSKITSSFRMNPACHVQRAKITDNRHNLEPDV